MKVETAILIFEVNVLNYIIKLDYFSIGLSIGVNTDLVIDQNIQIALTIPGHTKIIEITLSLIGKVVVYYDKILKIFLIYYRNGSAVEKLKYCKK